MVMEGGNKYSKIKYFKKSDRLKVLTCYLGLELNEKIMLLYFHRFSVNSFVLIEEVVWENGVGWTTGLNLNVLSWISYF